jgi:integrase
MRQATLSNDGVQVCDLRRRGDGRLWLRGDIWWIQYYVYGRQVRESSCSTREEVAVRLLARRRAEIEADTFVSLSARRLRYEQLRDGLYADYSANRRRWLRVGKEGQPYVCGISHLDPFFAGRRAVAISTTLIREFITKRQSEGGSNGTINRELALLRRMFNLAIEDGTLRIAPHFPMLKEAAPRKGFLEYTQFQRLRAELPEYLRYIFTMGYYTGMRLGEILNIRWSSVDLEKAEIRLEPGTTKNDEPRTIPLFAELREMLSIEREKHPNSEFIFLRKDHHVHTFYKAWRSACKRADLGRVLFHDLRRTGVRNLVRAGVPERVAMTISGHRTRAVFERYNIVSGRDLRDAAIKLDSYLAGEKARKTRREQKQFGDNSGTIMDRRANSQRRAHLN